MTGVQTCALPICSTVEKIGTAWALLLALAAVPIFSTVLPPLADYPNHLARFYLLAQGGNDYYAVRWAPLPNLAGDVIVPALAQAMPLGLAAKLFLVTTFALLTGGTLARLAAQGHRVVLVTATVYITLNLIADVAYILVNPRLRA